MDADRRAGEVDAVGDAGGDVVLLVGEHGVELADRLHQVGPLRDGVAVVLVVVLARVDADRPVVALGHVAGVLQRVPGELEHDALLRVHHHRFARADPEEGGVEEVDLVDDAARAHVARVVHRLGVEPRVELAVLEEGDRLLALADVVPQLLDRLCAGVAPHHADDRHPGVARHRRRPRGGGAQLRPRLLRPTLQQLAQLLGVGPLEQREQRHLEVMHLPQPRHRAQREQRVAAQLEEVVLRAHLLEVEQLGEHACRERSRPGCAARRRPRPARGGRGPAEAAACDRPCRCRPPAARRAPRRPPAPCSRAAAPTAARAGPSTGAARRWAPRSRPAACRRPRRRAPPPPPPSRRAAG